MIDQEQVDEVGIDDWDTDSDLDHDDRNDEGMDSDDDLLNDYFLPEDNLQKYGEHPMT